jgi:hypothetical protein
VLVDTKRCVLIQTSPYHSRRYLVFLSYGVRGSLRSSKEPAIDLFSYPNQSSPHHTCVPLELNLVLSSCVCLRCHSCILSSEFIINIFRHFLHVQCATCTAQLFLICHINSIWCTMQITIPCAVMFFIRSEYPVSLLGQNIFSRKTQFHTLIQKD